MAFCEVFHDQSPGTLAAGGDFGFKVLTASDRAEKLSAELTGGRLAMMAIIGMFFHSLVTTALSRWGEKRVYTLHLRRSFVAHD